MRAARYCFLFLILCLAVSPSYAQFAVFDASNDATAVHEYEQLQQVYTTANQTKDQIIRAYNLARKVRYRVRPD
jgi:predicted RNA-binding protein with PIN domain